MNEAVNGTDNVVLPMAIYKMNRRDNLKEFIRAYRDLPELWDMSNKYYSVKKFRNAAYDKLLAVYKKFDDKATVEDVRKKINIIRTNFRKQLKRFNEKRQMSGEEEDICYDYNNYSQAETASSWLFDELKFLIESEVPSLEIRTSMDDVMNTTVSDTEEEVQDASYVVHNPKKRKLIENERVREDFTFDFLEEEVCMARVWASKLKSLEPDQKLFAEKAINDILFEAKLSTLHRHSVQINQHDGS